ncbi:hypothetical protein AV656_06190 [Bhargavaea cecembensis]|uniref:Uncharacterized protein n=1 Tax=Bhargavaea cecembensis TaxID=394098 RepID=A0A161RF36_9BACL|nr:hypothetical protein AV656_06190 [Bhargavaea cecembensis]
MEFGLSGRDSDLENEIRTYSTKPGLSPQTRTYRFPDTLESILRLAKSDEIPLPVLYNQYV